MAKPKKVVSEDTTTTTRVRFAPDGKTTIANNDLDIHWSVASERVEARLKKLETLDSLAIVEARLKKLETFAADLMKGLHWAATRLKSTWGLSTVGAVLDELSKKLDK